MKNTQAELPFDCDQMFCYRIQVQGRIGSRWLDRMQGLAVTSTLPDVDPSLTILEGELLDQAALAGVLNTLFDLHLPLVSVERLAPRAKS
jgi:hypothetical protein